MKTACVGFLVHTAGNREPAFIKAGEGEGCEEEIIASPEESGYLIGDLDSVMLQLEIRSLYLSPLSSVSNVRS